MDTKIVILGWGSIAKFLCSFPNVIGYIKLDNVNIIYDSKTDKKLRLVDIDVEGVIGIGKNVYKEEITSVWLENNHSLGRLIHPSAYIGKNTQIGLGSVVMPLAFIDDSSIIGKSCIVGPQSALRAAKIGNYCHLSIQSRVLPNATLQDYVTLETNTTVLEGRIIGKHSVIGADVLVTKDIPSNHIYRKNTDSYTLEKLTRDFPLTQFEKEG